MPPQRIFTRFFTVLALLVAATSALAQVSSVEDYTRRPDAWELSLSPSGRYVAMAVPTPDGTETRLEILDLTTNKSQVLRFGNQQHVSDIMWTADEQVVVSRATLEPLKAVPSSMGELYTSDVHGKNQDVLFGYIPEREGKRGKRSDHGFAEVVKVLTDEPGMALVNFFCWDCGEEPDTVIFRVNTSTGERKEVERVGGRANFQFDRTGEARLRTTWDNNDQPVLYYRPSKGAEWVPLPKAVAGRLIYNARFADDNNTLYALVTDAGEPAQAYRIDLQAGTRTKLAGNPDVEASGFMYAGFGGPPFAVTYSASKPSLEYIDSNSDWAQLHASLMQLFPGEMVSFGSFSRDGNKVLFSVWSDRDPGSYYLFDRVAHKVQKIVDFRSWIRPETMVQTRPIEFTNRDGTKIFGFYTTRGTGPQPMVVMAHGGPYDVNDDWGFDSEVQFLASRGYAVLQVNYRGSSGRGESFEQAGWKGWSTTIQNDITDGVRWAITNHLADPARLCTFGASFGGYTALEQPLLNPGMYKCAIGYAGVYDLPLMRKTDENHGQTRASRRFWDRTLGTDMAALAQSSPALHAADIHIPVMLAHGGEDHTADTNQYKAMVAALQAAGNPAQTYFVEAEGHGFYKPENRAELYRRMDAFLSRYIGAGAVPATH